MVEIWQTIAASLAAIIHTSPEAAGILLGMTTIVVFFVGFLVLYAAMKITPSPFALAAPILIGLAFVGMTGWFPPWAVLFIVIVMAAIIGKRLMDGSSE